MGGLRLRSALVLLLGLLAVFLLLTREPTVTTEPLGRVADPVRERGSPRLQSARQPSLRTRKHGSEPARSTEVDVASEEDDGMPWASLRLETRDGQSGRIVPARWNLGTGNVIAGPFPPGMKITPEAVARSRQGVLDSIARWERAFLGAGDVRPEAVSPSRRLDWPYVLRLGQGYVLEAPSTRIVGEVAADAREVLWVVPVWQEAVLDLRVLDPEGRPAADVQIETLSAAGRRRTPVLEVCGAGEYRVRGIPSLPGEPVRAVLLWGAEDEPQGDFSGDFSGDLEEVSVLEKDAGTSLDNPQLVGVIPAQAASRWRMDVRLSRTRAADPGVAILSIDDMPFSESFGLGQGAPNPLARQASLQVLVLGWDGTPVRDATVGEEETDARGRVVLADLAPGKRTIRLSVPGRLPVSSTLSLAGGEEACVTLREPLGARLVVLVTDADGRPRPHARLSMYGHKIFDIVDGVQRLDLFTDALGRRSLERVEPGRAIIRASWGSRTGSASVDLPDGGTVNVHLILK